jgi:hypothetical protein
VILNGAESEVTVRPTDQETSEGIKEISLIVDFFARPGQSQNSRHFTIVRSTIKNKIYKQ